MLRVGRNSPATLRFTLRHVMHSSSIIHAFDLDGTLIDSEAVKLEAFASCFEGCSELDQIRHYNASHRGIPRKEKFEYICREILSVSDVTAEVDRLCGMYAEILDRKLRDCKLVPGVREFLSSFPGKKYAVSSAPSPEVKSQLQRFSLVSLLEGYFAYPVPKITALAKLRDSGPGHAVVFWGDSAADYEAATACSLPFVGIVRQQGGSMFDGVDVPIIKDFTDIPELERMIHSLMIHSKAFERTRLENG